MTATTLDRTYSTQKVADAAGVSYRMIDYWLRCGVPLGTRHGFGSGSRRQFTDDDIALATFLGRAAEVLPNGGNGQRSADKTLLLAKVAIAVRRDPAILDRPLVFIAFDGTISDTPVHGWVVAPAPLPHQQGAVGDSAVIHGTEVASASTSGRAPAQGAGPADETAPDLPRGDRDSVAGPAVTPPLPPVLAHYDLGAIPSLAANPIGWAPAGHRGDGIREHHARITAARTWCDQAGIDYRPQLAANEQAMRG